MTDLREICGLSIGVDEETGNVVFEDSILCETEQQITLSQISPFLLNKFLRYPEKVYSRHRGINLAKDDSQELSYDLYVLPYGLLGIEFIKTHIFYSKPKVNKYACIIEVVSGTLTVLIQKNKEEGEYSFVTFVESIDIIEVKKGERISIPTGVYYTFINTSSSQAVFTVVSLKGHSEIEKQELEKEKGLALYIISKNARLEIVSNPKYKIECTPNQVGTESFDEDTKNKYSHKLCNDDVPLFKAIEKYTQDLVASLA